MSRAGYSAKYVLHLFEEGLLAAVAGRRLDLLLRHDPGELFEQILLLAAQLLRDRGARNHVEVADAAARHVRHPLGAQLEARPGLRPGRHLDLLVADQRRHAHVTAERQRREGHRHLAIQVVPFAMEERVLLHVDDDVEIARRAAGGSVFPFAVQPEALAGGDSRGNLRGDLALAADAPGAAAGLARLADHPAAAAAGGAGSRHREEPLLEAKLPRALALRAHFRRAAGRGARPAAALAGLFARDLDRRLGAGERLLERDLEVVAQVRSALRSAATAAAAEHVAEAEEIAEVAEDVLEAGERVRIETARAGAADAGVAVAVVERPLLRVGDDGVGLRRFLEAFLRRAVARIAIRVVFQRQLAVRTLDLLIGGVAADAEDLVVIALAHPLATFTIAGRSRRSPSMYPRENSSMTSPSRRPSAGS